MTATNISWGINLPSGLAPAHRETDPDHDGPGYPTGDLVLVAWKPFSPASAISASSIRPCTELLSSWPIESASGGIRAAVSRVVGKQLAGPAALQLSSVRAQEGLGDPIDDFRQSGRKLAARPMCDL